MRRYKVNFRLVVPVLAFVFFSIRPAHAQSVNVENVRTDNFPELHFDLSADEDLVANRSRLLVKDNYVVVKNYKIIALKASAAGKGYVVTYTVSDPERLDGTTTFEYKGKAITTTYLAKKSSPAQDAAYPKIERTDNTLFYVVGGLAIVAGIAGFLLSRRRTRDENSPDVSNQIPPLPVSETNPVFASATPPTPPSEDAYKPRTQSALGSPHLIETQVSPSLMPTISLRFGDNNTVLKPNGTLQKIGRGPQCDLVISHPTVSKIHASIRLQNGVWWLEDLGSTNGTYVDGQRVTKAALHSNSQLYFGQVSGAFNLS